MTLSAILIIIGRILLGGYYLQAGLRNFMKQPLHVGILQRTGVPLPRVALLVALTAQVVGALSVMLGLYPAIGALLLIGFTLVALATYHDFWNYQGAERMSHLGSVLSHLATVGGFLLVIALSI